MANSKPKRRVITLILDGWGLAPDDPYNAIANAKTPNMEKLYREYPNTRLKSDGGAVGLPEGQPGTSEVNHMTIGAGKVILQDLPRLNTAIANETFYDNQAFLESINHATNNNGRLHFVGILSDGGVHSMDQHLFALFELLKRHKFKQDVYLHLFTDGRDTPPKSAAQYMALLEATRAEHPELKIELATYQGRFYLDRDRDWAKTDKAVDLICKGEGRKFSGWEAVLNYEYSQNNTDEYFAQYLLNEEGVIKPNDSVIFFHYRTDRLYQLVKRIIEQNIENLHLTTMIRVSEEFENVAVAFPREEINNTLAETIYKQGFSQLHITETEKYAHLTFFFNGEREHPFPHEEWKLIESNRFVKPFYNFEPNMRNFDICNGIVNAINTDAFDFIIANFSSPDMVGHTGNYHAAVISAESVDYCIGKIYEALKDKLDEYALIITADHGNSDQMWDYEHNQPHTQHTLSPVPFVLVSNIDGKLDQRESLSDVAPTILELMGIAKPEVMTGSSLIIKKSKKDNK